MYGGLVVLDTEVLSPSNAQDVGRRLANIPMTQFSLLSKYQLTDKLAIAGAATYGGEVYGGHLAANAFNNHTVDWWRFDAFAEYKLTQQHRPEDLRCSISRTSSTTMPSTRRKTPSPSWPPAAPGISRSE